MLSTIASFVFLSLIPGVALATTPLQWASQWSEWSADPALALVEGARVVTRCKVNSASDEAAGVQEIAIVESQTPSTGRLLQVFGFKEASRPQERWPLELWLGSIVSQEKSAGSVSWEINPWQRIGFPYMLTGFWERLELSKEGAGIVKRTTFLRAWQSLSIVRATGVAGIAGHAELLFKGKTIGPNATDVSLSLLATCR